MAEMDSRNTAERNYVPNLLDPQIYQAHASQNIASQMYHTNNSQNISSQIYQPNNLMSQNNFQRPLNFGPRGNYGNNSFFGSIDHQSTCSVGQNDHQIQDDVSPPPNTYQESENYQTWKY